VYSRRYLLAALLTFSLMTLPGISQTAQTHPPRGNDSGSSSDEVAPVIRTFTRIVTLEVVVKDAKGKHVPGLKPEDFQLFEQIPSQSKEKREQKIASFREVSMAELAVPGAGLAAQIPAGIYTNVASSLKDPIPPTIILVDGLNTDVRYQAQIYVQMLKMLQHLPTDVPVAVFLLGRKLVMLQDFTSDPKLLQAALSKATTADGQNLAQLDPRDDPHSVLSVLLNSGLPIPREMIEAAAQGDARDYSEHMDSRVRGIEDALISIARHMSGYPGRKNLLWISTAFPISIAPSLDPSRDHDYQLRIQRVASALSDAKIAVYPINPAGVVGAPVYMVPERPSPGNPPTYTMTKLEREKEARQADTMQAMADATGGSVCIGDNDLADCVRHAVDDSSKFYEIAYHPDSKDWNGEYRRIILIAKLKGLHLEYRQGYFANVEGSENDSGAKDELQRAACAGSLDATSIFLAARSLPTSSNEAMKFYLMINPAALTFTVASNGGQQVKLRLGVCTFDETGKPLHYMSDNLDQRFTPSEYQSLLKAGLPHVVSIAGRKPASVRLAVMDSLSGKIGSVSVKVGRPAAAGSVAAK
jgi:VWFA-related protein